jgi:hypothetical protein
VAEHRVQHRSHRQPGRVADLAEGLDHLADLRLVLCLEDRVVGARDLDRLARVDRAILQPRQLDGGRATLQRLERPFELLLVLLQRRQLLGRDGLGALEQRLLAGLELLEDVRELILDGLLGRRARCLDQVPDACAATAGRQRGG